MIEHTGDSKTTDDEENSDPHHWDELLIQIDEFNYLLCDIFGHVAVSRIFLIPFESIRVFVASVPLPVLLEWTSCLTLGVFVFYMPYQMCSI